MEKVSNIYFQGLYKECCNEYEKMVLKERGIPLKTLKELKLLNEQKAEREIILF